MDTWDHLPLLASSSKRIPLLLPFGIFSFPLRRGPPPAPPTSSLLLLLLLPASTWRPGRLWRYDLRLWIELHSAAGLRWAAAGWGTERASSPRRPTPISPLSSWVHEGTSEPCRPQFGFSRSDGFLVHIWHPWLLWELLKRLVTWTWSTFIFRAHACTWITTRLLFLISPFCLLLLSFSPSPPFFFPAWLIRFGPFIQHPAHTSLWPSVSLVTWSHPLVNHKLWRKGIRLIHSIIQSCTYQTRRRWTTPPAPPGGPTGWGTNFITDRRSQSCHGCIGTIDGLINGPGLASLQQCPGEATWTHRHQLNWSRHDRRSCQWPRTVGGTHRWLQYGCLSRGAYNLIWDPSNLEHGHSLRSLPRIIAPVLNDASFAKSTMNLLPTIWWSGTFHPF